MDILKSATKRILVRNADKIISTTGNNLLVGMSDYSPRLPTVKKIIVNVLCFIALNLLLIKIFMLIGFILLAYVTPLFFIGRIIRPLFFKHIYRQKQEAILVADRRYQSGTRTTGYKFVKDKTKRYDFSQEEIKLSRIEGGIKLIIAVLLTVWVNNYYSQPHWNLLKDKTHVESSG